MSAGRLLGVAMACAVMVSGCGDSKDGSSTGSGGSPAAASKDEQQAVVAAAKTFLAAVDSRDAKAICLAMRPGARRSLDRLAHAQGRPGCSRIARKDIGISAEVSRSGSYGRVAVDGDRATVGVPGVVKDLALARESGGAWQVNPFGDAESQARIKLSVVCSRSLRVTVRRKLLPLTRAQLAVRARQESLEVRRYVRQLRAVKLTGFAAEERDSLAAQEQKDAETLLGLSRKLKTDANLDPLLKLYNKALRRHIDLPIESRLGLDCGPDPYRGASADRWVERSKKICKAEDRAVKKLGRIPQGGYAAAAAWQRRQAAINRATATKLRKLRVPAKLKRLVGNVITANRQVAASWEKQAAALDRSSYDTYKAEFDRLDFLGLRLGTAWVRSGASRSC